MTTRDYHVSLHITIYFIHFIHCSTEEMNIVGLFSRAKCLQQPAATKVGEEIKVNMMNHMVSWTLSDIEYVFEGRNSRSGNKGKLVPSSSCGQEDSDCNKSGKEFGEAHDENQDCLEDCCQV